MSLFYFAKDIIPYPAWLMHGYSDTSQPYTFSRYIQARRAFNPKSRRFYLIRRHAGGSVK